MLKPPREFFSNQERFNARITLASGETEKGRYKSWLAEILREPRYCQRHPQTRLVVNRHASSIREAHKGDEEGRWPYGNQPEIEPGTFHFEAVLRCPACHCAAAHCPPEFHTTSFEKFDTSTPERANALARCREFVAQVNKHGRGMAQFVGRSGTGKTRLASNIIRELEHPGALYVRQGQLTTELRATYGRKDVFVHLRRSDDEDEQPTPLEIVQSVCFLVLDEIGCAPLANDERLLLDELLKHRYDRGKPTILISNLALDQLKDFLGDALTDRIKHATGNGKFILQFSGESFRRTTGENYLEVLK